MLLLQQQLFFFFSLGIVLWKQASEVAAAKGPIC